MEDKEKSWNGSEEEPSQTGSGDLMCLCSGGLLRTVCSSLCGHLLCTGAVWERGSEQRARK